MVQVSKVQGRNWMLAPRKEETNRVETPPSSNGYRSWFDWKSLLTANVSKGCDLQHHNQFASTTGLPNLVSSTSQRKLNFNACDTWTGYTSAHIKAPSPTTLWTQGWLAQIASRAHPPTWRTRGVSGLDPECLSKKIMIYLYVSFIHIQHIHIYIYTLQYIDIH